MMLPAASWIGEMVSEMSMRRPSLRTRTVSKWSTRSPRRICARMVASSSIRSGGSKIRDRPADHLVGGVAEDALGGRVPTQDDAVEIFADDGVVGRSTMAASRACNSSVCMMVGRRVSLRVVHRGEFAGYADAVASIGDNPA